MTALAALVLASTLAATGGIEAPSAEPDAAQTRRAERLERRRQRMLKLHLAGGIALEVASTGLHALTAVGFIGADANLPPEGCAAANMPCRGTPIVLFLPVGAVATGWIGATRLAAAREANIWRSPMFWAGTAMTVLWIIPAVNLGGANTRNERLTVDAIMVASLVSGTAMQMWGAFLAPPREAPAASGSLRLAPGCGPTAGGVVCGLALAGF